VGLFKSREERRIERDMQVRKGIATMKRRMKELARDEKEYVKKARRAKQLGDKSQFEFIKQNLRRTAAQGKLMERQLLTIETAFQMKNQAEAHGQFAKSINAISSAIGEVFGATDLTATQKDFEKAMAQAENMEQRMEIFLDMAESSASISTTVDDAVSDKEIDAMIDDEISHEESSGLDREISKGLAEIEKELGKEEK
jgi:hypothetical protein